MAQRKLLKLVGVDVEGLFGIYDHRIDLNVDDRVTILHGPNGVGKTTILKMIDALMGNRLEYFGAVPFSRFRLRFVDGASLEVGPCRGAHSLDVVLVKDGETAEAVTVDLSVPGRAASLVADVPYMDRNPDGSDSWVDRRDGQVLSDWEILREFGRRSSVVNFLPTPHEPLWLAEFLARGSVHLIETHRLERRERGVIRRAVASRYAGAVRPSVLECGRDLQRRLNDAMAEFGRESQALDQAFPVQLLSAANEPALTNQELEHRLAAVDDVTEELISLGILNGPVGHELAKKGIVDYEGEAVAQVMTLYVKNAEQKLAVLRDLANRVRTLLGGVNSKFKHKRLRLDREKGLVAEGDAGPLALDSLSSGEQHEIVLHYNLLFMVQPNTVVLIDEPEISLHVAWQKAFLGDLLAMAELSGFDALIATHSPYIAGERTDLMVALGDAT
ncbi:MAG: AAA family ATPase [Gammaproteobacteria bacterium]|nr:AAA family ATPase [Gammaproteobacteria bacterium]